MIKYTTGKYCSVPFIRMVILKDFIHRFQSENDLVELNKQHHRKYVFTYLVCMYLFIYLNGHTYGTLMELSTQVHTD